MEKYECTCLDSWNGPCKSGLCLPKPQQVFEKCSFCGKGRREVAIMVAGLSGAYICGNCVAICLKVVGDFLVSKLPTHQQHAQIEKS